MEFNRPKITEDTVLNTYHATREPWANDGSNIYTADPKYYKQGSYGTGLYSAPEVRTFYGNTHYDVMLDDTNRYIRANRPLSMQPEFVQEAFNKALLDNRTLTKDELNDVFNMPTTKQGLERSARRIYDKEFPLNRGYWLNNDLPDNIYKFLRDYRNFKMDEIIKDLTPDSLNIKDLDFNKLSKYDYDKAVKLLEPYGVRGINAGNLEFQTSNPMASIIVDPNNPITKAEAVRIFNERINKGLLPAYVNPNVLNQEIDFKALLNTDIPIPKAAANLMKNPVVKGLAGAAGVAAIPLDVYFAHQDAGVPLAKTVDYEKQLRQPTEFASLSPQDQEYIKSKAPNMNTQTEFKTTPLDILKQYGAEQKQAWNTIGDYINIMKPSLKPLTEEEERKLWTKEH